MKKLVFVLLISIFCTNVYSQNLVWVYFKDKPNAAIMLAEPERYLSQKSIARREKQNIPIQYSDLPVSENYIARLKGLDVQVRQRSRWLNAVSVHATQDQIVQLKKQHFVTKIAEVHSLQKTENNLENSFSLAAVNNTAPYEYGPSANQIFMMNGDYLHNNNWRGQNMLIAVLDGGFTGANQFMPFDSLWNRNGVLATKDFVDGDQDVFHNGSHGMNVLSVLAGNVPFQLIGSAPMANYLLLKSEDQSSETPIEEDNWVAAAEFADSAGADIITSSLGYATFDGGVGNYTWDDLDGRTATTSKAAVMAARKGILVVNSAGNEGRSSWQKIITPADADSILAIGGVDAQRNYVLFSSVGPTADGRIKPDVSAQAQGVYLASTTGGITNGNGTSFAAPLVSGLSACLWQNHPHATAMEVRDAVMQSAHLYDDPNNQLGYGIPDFYLADFFLTNNENLPYSDDDLSMMPNPIVDNVTLFARLLVYPAIAEIQVFDVLGNRIDTREIKVESRITVLTEYQNLPAGVYVFQVNLGSLSYKEKMVKL